MVLVWAAMLAAVKGILWVVMSASVWATAWVEVWAHWLAPVLD